MMTATHRTVWFGELLGEPALFLKLALIGANAPIRSARLEVSVLNERFCLDYFGEALKTTKTPNPHNDNMMNSF